MRPALLSALLTDGRQLAQLALKEAAAAFASGNFCAVRRAFFRFAEHAENPARALFNLVGAHGRNAPQKEIRRRGHQHAHHIFPGPQNERLFRRSRPAAHQPQTVSMSAVRGPLPPSGLFGVGLVFPENFLRGVPVRHAPGLSGRGCGR